MSKDDDTITGLFKRNTIIAVTLLGSTIALIILLLLINSFINSKRSTINSTLLGQAILIQTITKDVNRVYELNLQNEKSSIMEEKSKNQMQIEKIKRDIKQSEGDYETQYQFIKKWYIVTGLHTMHMESISEEILPLINNNYLIWTDYKKNINAILQENGDTSKTIAATNYINDNEAELYNSNKKIINGAEKYIEFLKNIIIFIFIIAITIFLLLTILFTHSLYKNLYMPINELMDGIGEIGNGGPNNVNTLFKNKESMPMYTEVRTFFQKVSGLYNLTENLNKNLPFKDFLNYVFKSFSQIIPYNSIAVGLLDGQRKYITISYKAVEPGEENILKEMMGYKFPIEGTKIEEIFETGEISVINNIQKHIKNKPSAGAYNKVLLKEGIKSYITYPLINRGIPVGIIVFPSKLKNAYNKHHIKMLKIIAGVMLVSLEEDIFINDMVISSTMALASLAEERDTDTGRHLDRVQKYSKLLAEIMSKEEKYADVMDVEYVNNIEKFSPLHDIGKVAIRDEILLKPGNLTYAEFKTMKTHTLYGGRVLRLAEENIKKKGRSIFKMGIEIAECHHEKWDGSGYPYGKRKEEIPLSARIVALADVFDALTSKRPYKEAFGFDESVSIIKKEKGSHFDPYIVDAFLNNLQIFKNVYLEFGEDTCEKLS